MEGWLLKELSGLFNGLIKKDVQSSLRIAITKAIDITADQVLSTLNLVQKLNSYAEIDFSLCPSPVFDPSYLSFGSKGEFYYIPHPSEAPVPIANIPYENYNGEMLQIFLSDFLFNSASYVLFEAGVLDYVVNASMVPPNSPFQLNTTSFKYLVPPLYQMFPNCEMRVVVSAAQFPLAQFKPSGFYADLVGDMLIQVVLPNGTLFDAFILEAVIGTQGNVSAKKYYIYCDPFFFSPNQTACKLLIIISRPDFYFS